MIFPLTIQPDIWLGQIRISEPIIALTGLMIGAVCLYAVRRIARTTADSRVVRFIRAFLLLMMFSTLTGAFIGHAFLYALDFAWKLPSWMLSLASVAALERAAILHARPMLRPFWSRFFLWWNTLNFVVFAVILFQTLNFHVVEAHAVVSLLLVTGGMELFVWIKKRDRGSLFLLANIGIAVVAVSFHLLHFSFCRWFTYFDIGHIVLCFGMWTVMRGAETLKIYEREQLML